MNTIRIIQGDITQADVDAVVNAAKPGTAILNLRIKDV